MASRLPGAQKRPNYQSANIPIALCNIHARLAWPHVQIIMLFAETNIPQNLITKINRITPPITQLIYLFIKRPTSLICF